MSTNTNAVQAAWLLLTRLALSPVGRSRADRSIVSTAEVIRNEAP